MNRLDIVSTGFPETTKTWIYTQAILREGFKALTDIIGGNAIISGAQITDTTVSDGLIVYNGEIYKFVGGVWNDTVSIIETVDNVAYNTDVNDDSVLDVLPAYVTRYAICGTGLPNTADTFDWDDLKLDMQTLIELSDFEIEDASETVKGIAKIATQTLANGDTDDSTILTIKKLVARVATNARKGMLALATTQEVRDGVEPTKAITPKTLRDAGIYPFEITGGTVLTNSSGEAYVYPPSGYTMADLDRIIPSIAQIWFDGNVDDNDILQCTFAVQSTRVVITCKNSEQEQNAKVNYLAIWHK